MKRTTSITVLLLIMSIIIGCNLFKPDDKEVSYNCLKSINIDGSEDKIVKWEFEYNYIPESYTDDKANALRFSYDGTRITNGNIVMDRDGSNSVKLLPDSLLMISYCYNNNFDSMYCTVKGKRYKLVKIDLSSFELDTLIDTLDYATVSMFHSEERLLLHNTLRSYIYDIEENIIVKDIVLKDVGYPVISNDDNYIYYKKYSGNLIMSYNILTEEIEDKGYFGNLYSHDKNNTKFVIYAVGECRLIEIDNDDWTVSSIGGCGRAFTPTINSSGDYISSKTSKVEIYDSTGLLISEIEISPRIVYISPNGTELFYYSTENH